MTNRFVVCALLGTFAVGLTLFRDPILPSDLARPAEGGSTAVQYRAQESDTATPCLDQLQVANSTVVERINTDHWTPFNKTPMLVSCQKKGFYLVSAHARFRGHSPLNPTFAIGVNSDGLPTGLVGKQSCPAGTHTVLCWGVIMLLPGEHRLELVGAMPAGNGVAASYEIEGWELEVSPIEVNSHAQLNGPQRFQVAQMTPEKVVAAIMLFELVQKAVIDTVNVVEALKQEIDDWRYVDKASDDGDYDRHGDSGVGRHEVETHDLF
jgi:hypothetical protein